MANKLQTSAAIINANSDKPAVDLVKMIMNATGCTEFNSRCYFNQALNKKLAVHTGESFARAARGTAAPKEKVTSTEPRKPNKHIISAQIVNENSSKSANELVQMIMEATGCTEFNSRCYFNQVLARGMATHTGEKFPNTRGRKPKAESTPRVKKEKSVVVVAPVKTSSGDHSEKAADFMEWRKKKAETELLEMAENAPVDLEPIEEEIVNDGTIPDWLPDFLHDDWKKGATVEE